MWNMRPCGALRAGDEVIQVRPSTLLTVVASVMGIAGALPCAFGQHLSFFALVAPSMKARADELGGIKGLAAGGADSLYAVSPGVVLQVKLDGTFTTVRQPVVAADCDRYLPTNTPPAHEPFLTGLTVSPRGEIYLAAIGCRCVLKLDSEGRISTVLKAESPWSPTGLALNGEDVYVAEWTNAHSESTIIGRASAK